MLDIVYRNITLDVLKVGAQATVNAKTGDANSRGVEITLVKGGEPYEIPEGYSAEMRLLINGAGSTNQSEGNPTIEGNKILYTFTTEDLAVPGSWQCEVKIYGDGNPTYALYSPCFALLVEGILFSDGTPEDSQAYTNLDNAINAANRLNISATKSGNTATITVTNRDNQTTEVQIEDGEDGEAAEISGASASATTLDPDEDATVSVTAGGTAQARTFAFSFGIPKGEKGDTGDTGATGPQGPQGATGAQGPQGETGPAGAAAGFGTVSASATAGESAAASVEESGPDTAKNLHFNFVIPAVADGDITTAKLADGAVTDAKIASVSAAKIRYALPEGCVPLKFLRSTGTQYINTEIAPVFVKNENGQVVSATALSIKANYAQAGGTANANLFFCGASDSASLSNGTRNGILFGRNTDGAMRGVYSNRLGVFDSLSRGGTYQFSPYASGVSYRYNGVQKDNQTSLLTTINQNAPIYLFALNLTTSAAPYYCDCAIISGFSLGLYENSSVTKLAEMVPVLDPNGVPCMYDTVRARYFYNAGSGQFLWG